MITAVMRRKRLKNRSKKVCQSIHARRRALERYGFYPEPESIRYVVQQIQSGKATLVERQSQRVSIWDVITMAGFHCRVVYDRVRKNIVTFLPIQEVVCE